MPSKLLPQRLLDCLNKNLLEPNHIKFNTDKWIYHDGIPANAVIPESDRFEKVEAAMKKFLANYDANTIDTKAWTTHEWLHFIRYLPDNLSADDMKKIDAAFHFTNSGNSEMADAWFEQSINKGYKAAYPKMEKFLIGVGRRKFLTPLYKALLKTDDGKKTALEIYVKARPNYHAIATRTLDELLGYRAD